MYTVYYKAIVKSQNEDNFWYHINTSSGANELRDLPLDCDEEYEFKVSAWNEVGESQRSDPWRVKSILGISISLPVSTFPEIIQHRLSLVVGIAVWKQNFFSETRRLDVTDQDGDSHDFAAYQSLFVNDALLCYCYLRCLIPCNSQLEINPLFLFYFLSFFFLLRVPSNSQPN